jgi:hypothetical protein
MWIIDLFYKSCTVILIAQIIKEIHENKEYYKQECINMIFSMLHYYSKCETLYNLYIKSYVEYIYNSLYIERKIPIYSSIEFYSEGVLIINKDNITKEENISLLKNEYEPEKYDLIIYNDYNTLKLINKVCYYKLPDKLIYEQSLVKFLSLILLYNKESFEIILINDKYNYYIVNNVIDKKFLYYYLYYVCKYYKLCKFEDFAYQLNLIDNNVNVKTLNETQSLTIGKNDYQIHDIIRAIN